MARHADPAAVRGLVAALGCGTAGGLLFAWLAIPLGWLLGAMFASAAAAFGRLGPSVPGPVRSTVIGILGVLIGGGFERERLETALLWLPSAGLLLVYVPLVGAVSLWYLRRFARLGPYTAFFAATPGGLSEMVLLSDRAGADMRSVALVHATRVLTIVALAPFFVEAAGGAPRAAPPEGVPDPGELVVLALAGLAGAVVARRLTLPAPDLLGPLLTSAGLHLSGWVTAEVPRPVVIFAQIAIGAAIGSRFRGLDPAHALRQLLGGLGLTATMFALTAVFATVLHLVTGLPLVALVLAYVPGGVVEMGAVALALGIDPAFVATHHLLRIALVVFLAPLLFPLWRRFVERRRESERRPGGAASVSRGERR